MIAADRAALLARLKQRAVEIREKELSFFTTSFQTIGTQAALIGGFAYTTIGELDYTDKPLPDGTCVDGGKQLSEGLCRFPVAPSLDCCALLYYYPTALVPNNLYTPDTYFQPLYFMWSSLCVVGSLICVVGGTYLTILAPSLALRGPDGALAFAVDGMRFESRTLVVAFATCIVCFFGATISLCLDTLKRPLAFICAAILSAGISHIVYMAYYTVQRFKVPPGDGLDVLANLEKMLSEAKLGGGGGGGGGHDSMGRGFRPARRGGK